MYVGRFVGICISCAQIRSVLAGYDIQYAVMRDTKAAARLVA